jgi:hypothetical protein
LGVVLQPKLRLLGLTLQPNPLKLGLCKINIKNIIIIIIISVIIIIISVIIILNIVIILLSLNFLKNIITVEEK